MNWKLASVSRPTLNLVQVLAGLGLLVVLFFSLNALLTSRNQQTLQATDRPRASITHTLSPSPTVSANQVNPTAEWETYIEPELSYSVKYPPSWRLGVSKSDGFPYLRWLDPVAQQVLLPKTEINQGAIVQIYTAPWLGKDKASSSLKSSLKAADPTFGGVSPDLKAMLTIREATAGQIVGVRKSLRTKYYDSEVFAFFKDYGDQTLLFRFTLTVFKPGADSQPSTDNYVQVLDQMIDTLTFTASQ